jgi:hypothetical protein
VSKTRGQLKADVQDNLSDLNLNFFSDDDLNQSFQDAYDDIAILTQCIQKITTQNWISNLSYYNFQSLGVTDYLGTIAIFNNITNLWLRDDLSLKDFDRIRRDWETWVGTPMWWAPSDPLNIAIAAKYMVTSGAYAFEPTAFSNAFYIESTYGTLGTFKLYYWALAPSFATDSDVPLVASDMQDLFTNYVTADLLEQAQEFTKASDYWKTYNEHIDVYSDRVKRNCKSDLLLRI